MIMRYKAFFNSLEKNKFKKFVPDRNPGSIYIYGGGSFARELLNILNKNDYQIKGFLDHQINLLTIDELPVHIPEEIPFEDRDNLVVIIGIHNRDADVNGIISHLSDLGYKNILTSIDFCDTFGDDLGTHFWLTKRSFYADHETEIETVFNLLSDQRSRDNFEAIVRFRISGDYSLLPQPDLMNQYFPIDLIPRNNPLRLIDCGAFDGDTLREILKLKIPIESVAAFEPDLDNFQKLSRTVQSKKITNAMLWPCGVYSKTTQMLFSPDNNEGGTISSNGKNLIQCISLDDVIPNFAPTMIIMDIEGAEIEALKGAQNIIQKYRPILAISSYHHPAHLWEIPMLIEQWDQDYNFHYRLHRQSTFESVLYAIPANK